MKTMTKFDERKRLTQFSAKEVRAALDLLSRGSEQLKNVACNEVGASIFGSSLYQAGAAQSLNADLLDAAMRFLERYGFVVETGRLRWVVRKSLTVADVDEACEIVPLTYAPMYPRETPFDTLRRVRKA
jgi:hypothetical protein